jgi:hypothetical protein
MEHADDMAVASTTPEGLQRHLDRIQQWCSENFLQLNEGKTEIMIFGPIPHSLSPFTLNGKPLRIEPEVTYVGITFQSTSKDIFDRHYRNKAFAANLEAKKMFASEIYCGRNRLPPRIARNMYSALVDCHLIHGSDVIIDVEKRSLERLESVQKSCLRRIMGLTSNSVIAPLYTELALFPIRERRLILALRFLKYLIGMPRDSHVRQALETSWELFAHGHPGWIGDVDHMLRSLVEPLALPSLHSLTPNMIDALIKEVRSVCVDDLERQISKIPRLFLLVDRKEPLEEDEPRLIHMYVRHYLHRISISSHRRSMIKLILGEHTFNAHTWRGRIDGDDCRMCKKLGINGVKETPQHALMQCCSDARTMEVRAELFASLAESAGLRRPERFSDDSALFWMRRLIFHWDWVVPMARFVHMVYMIWSGKEAKHKEAQEKERQAAARRREGNESEVNSDMDPEDGSLSGEGMFSEDDSDSEGSAVFE